MTDKADVDRVEHFQNALRDVVKASRSRMYQGCPDCDNAKCDADKECQVAPLDRAGQIAAEALAERPLNGARPDGCLCWYQADAYVAKAADCPLHGDTPPKMDFPTWELYNAVARMHGEACQLARSFRDTLCRTLDTAERRTKAGRPLEQDFINAMTARLVDDTKKLDGEKGRPVPLHASGPATFVDVPPEEHVQETPSDEAVQGVIDVARATGMPRTALRWALHRLDDKELQP